MTTSAASPILSSVPVVGGTFEPATREQSIAARRAVQSNERGHGLPLGVTDYACLAFVCLECETIGACSSRADRDNFVRNFDATCCSEETTILFLTREV